MKSPQLPLKTILFLIATLVFSLGHAQKPKTKLKASFTYEFQQEEGTNASAVAWDSERELYATVIAGNESFPFETFSKTGKPLAQGVAGFDWRGLWYNPKMKSFEGNGAGDNGWALKFLDDQNQPDNVEIEFDGQHQPDFQSVGTLDYLKKNVVFLNYEAITIDLYAYDEPDQVASIELPIDAGDIEDYNNNSIGFTGVAGYEFVLHNFNLSRLEFFDRQGKRTAISKLPKGAPNNDLFAFSFANGHAFLYDKDLRIWTAYKVF